MNANRAIVIQSHGSENVNASPSRISANIERRARTSAAGRRVARSAAKLIKNVRPSKTKAQPGPALTTMSPPMAGPTMRAP